MRKIRALTFYSRVSIRDQQDPSCGRALFYRLIRKYRLWPDIFRNFEKSI